MADVVVLTPTRQSAKINRTAILGGQNNEEAISLGVAAAMTATLLAGCGNAAASSSAATSEAASTAESTAAESTAGAAPSEALRSTPPILSS